jgi:hypothetical protein
MSTLPISTAFTPIRNFLFFGSGFIDGLSGSVIGYHRPGGRMRSRPEELPRSPSLHRAAQERLTEEIWHLNRLPTDREHRPMFSGLGPFWLSGCQLSVVGFT